ncbi:type II secretion system F family protein [Candidatus Woesearchaeota archaeon]|nr:type II secretion system F family protein [Candidatus Woesearchaeota archaeon]
MRFLKKKRKNKSKKKESLFLTEIVRDHFPELKKKLLKSRSKYSPEEYLKRTIRFAMQFSLMLIAVLLIFIIRAGKGYLYVIPTFLLLFIFLFWFHYKIPEIQSLRLQREIDRQLLYLARHLLIAIDSGETLLNSMSKVAVKSYGTAGRMFREIVDEIKLGTNVEIAIQKSIDRSPSENLTRILLEIQNSQKIGTDISASFNRFIRDLQEQGEIGIQRYSKKMNSLTLFYLVIGVVFPSIGIAMGTIFASLINLRIGFNDLLIVTFFIIILQAMFLSLYKTLRRSVIV